VVGLEGHLTRLTTRGAEQGDCYQGVDVRLRLATVVNLQMKAFSQQRAIT
jgi:hypothetical protein